MLGRKILEHPLGDDEVAYEAEAGLRVKGLRVAALRINTEYDHTWNKPLQESTNLSVGLDRPWTAIPSSAIFTPNSSHTFGRPNPTSVTPAVSRRLQDDSRRNLRYLCAEQRLASALRICSNETPPEDLQIHALEKATALLSAHVKEAQERAAELRAFLADREVDPETYRSLQRERWMEERRCAFVDRESKVLQERLVSLGASPKGSSSPPPSKTRKSRQEANLATFFSRSLTRTSITHRDASSAYLYRSPTRMTLKDVTPMGTRTSSLITALSKPIPMPLHVRSRSLGEQKSAPTSRVAPSLRDSFCRDFGRVGSSLSTLTEDMVVDSSSTSCPSLTAAATAADSVPSHADDQQTALSEPGSPVQQESIDEWKPLPNEGIARIYSPPQPRSETEILAGLRVTLPDYALDLMDSLDIITMPNTLLQATRSPTDSIPERLSGEYYFVPLDDPDYPPHNLPDQSIHRSSFSRASKRKRWSSMKKPSCNLSLFSIPESSPLSNSHTPSRPQDLPHSLPRRRSQSETHRSGLQRVLPNAFRPSSMDIGIDVVRPPWRFSRPRF